MEKRMGEEIGTPRSEEVVYPQGLNKRLQFQVS